LSHSLFVIVMEALNKIFYATINGGFLSRFSRVLGTLVRLIFHIYYLWMTLWFIVGSSLTTFAVRVLYSLCFKVVSGLKINLVKSELVLLGNVDNVDGLAVILD
jgi:hypothetical protein